MIPRIEPGAFGWAYDVRHAPPRRPKTQAAGLVRTPRDLEDRVTLSPAAMRLLEQTERLRHVKQGSTA